MKLCNIPKRLKTEWGTLRMVTLENMLIETQDKKGSIQTYQCASAKSLTDTLPGLRRREEMEHTPAEERTGEISPS